jgi:hypothetical protein
MDATVDGGIHFILGVMQFNERVIAARRAVATGGELLGDYNTGD